MTRVPRLLAIFLPVCLLAGLVVSSLVLRTTGGFVGLLASHEQPTLTAPLATSPPPTTEANLDRDVHQADPQRIIQPLTLTPKGTQMNADEATLVPSFVEKAATKGIPLAQAPQMTQVKAVAESPQPVEEKELVRTANTEFLPSLQVSQGPEVNWFSDAASIQTAYEEGAALLTPPNPTAYAVGARCRDNWVSELTSPSVCDGHGGVSAWIWDYE